MLDTRLGEKYKALIRFCSQFDAYQGYKMLKTKGSKQYAQNYYLQISTKPATFFTKGELQWIADVVENFSDIDSNGRFLRRLTVNHKTGTVNITFYE